MVLSAKEGNVFGYPNLISCIIGKFFFLIPTNLCFGSLKQAVAIDKDFADQIPSTKGVL